MNPWKMVMNDSEQKTRTKITKKKKIYGEIGMDSQGIC